MFNPIEFLFQKRLTSVLGIDIGTSSIKIAELRREEAGKFRLVNYAIMEMHHLQEEGGFRGLSFDIPDAELAKYIKILIKEAGFNSETAVMSLPVFSTFVTIMRMPALNEKELAGAIPLQAREYIPIPISEVVLDWKLIRTTKKSDLIRAELAKRTGGDDASGGNEAAGASGADEASGKAPGAAIAARKAESEVLLMAAPRDMVQKYVRVAQMANLTLAGLEI
ncbi:MAG: pilus assembly protein PilM, partial [bacterium]|nr:pilus assembly protein PilM [bacterium]